MSLFSRVALFSVMTTATVFGAATHSASVTVTETLHAGSTTLKPGNYNLHWAADNGDTDVTLTQGSHHFTIPVTVKPGGASDQSAVLTESDPQGAVLKGFQVKSFLLTVR